jgi:hypothetical protein
VFDPTGHFREQVRFVCEGDPREDLLFFGSDDLVFMVEGFMSAALSGLGGVETDEDGEAEPMEIVCYRMQ